MDYVTLDELKASQELHGTTYADHDLTLAISAASRAIDERCGRRFGRDSSASARVYTPLSGNLVLIDDAISITMVETDQNGDGTFEQAWAANTEYVAWPLNASADGVPYTRITRHPLTGQFFPLWVPRSVRVTATWGWPAVPDQIRQATMLLAARLVKRSREAPFGVAMIGIDVGAAARIAAVDPDVRLLTDPLIRQSAIY